MKCTLSNHDACSINVALRFSHLLEVVDHLSNQDILSYGTSDPTINPIELLATAAVVEEFSLPGWIFFNYPLAEPWVRQDKEIIFGPYGFAYDDLWQAAKAVVGQDLFDRLTAIGMNNMIDDKIGDLTLKEVADIIKDFRSYSRNFVAVNIIKDDLSQQRVYVSRRDKLFRNHFAGMKFKTVVGEGKYKIGGALVYFLNGYYIAKMGLTVLLPHNVWGDVWSAFAAGVNFAGQKIRAFPVGGVDMMTEKQLQLFKQDRRWRKAPVEAAAALRKHPFYQQFKKRLLQRQYCGVVYSEEKNKFYFYDFYKG